MKLHDLKPEQGAKKDRVRVGRGTAARRGKTAGRGTKGAGARAWTLPEPRDLGEFRVPEERWREMANEGEG